MEYQYNVIISKNDETIFNNNLKLLLDKKDYRYEIYYKFNKIENHQISINLDIHTNDKYDDYIFEFVWGSLFKKIKFIEAKIISRKSNLYWGKPIKDT